MFSVGEDRGLMQQDLNRDEMDEDIIDEYALVASGTRVLDEEKQATLFEILKCAVCLEIPKGKHNVQVRICEKGHHFCSPCHKKLRNCAICRGRLFIGRNFVVEELITKLGPHLGISKYKVPVPESAPKNAPGTFRCLHQCSATSPSSKLLQHIRTHHSNNLVDNVRSNPYSHRFDWIYNVTWVSNSVCPLTFNIADMGLFTTIINFYETEFRVYIQMLSEPSVSSLYKFRITVRTIVEEEEISQEISLGNCTVFSYSTDPRDIDSKSYLKMTRSSLNENVKDGDSLQILISIWKSKEKKVDKDFDITSLVPVPNVFPNDRKIRRNHNRNMRKKKLKLKLKLKSQHAEGVKAVTDGISAMDLVAEIPIIL